MRYLSNVSTLRYSPDQCIGCGRCTEVCPHGVFKMGDKRAILTDRNLCMECGACARNCDFKAIRVNAGVGCAAAVIRGIATGGEPTCGCGNPAGGN